MQYINNIDSLKIINSLLLKGNFLKLSRFNPKAFAQPIAFSIAQHTSVKIFCEGVIFFESRANGGKDIILSCGVHGNETAPIEMCDAFVKDILLGKLIIKQRVLFIFGNLNSMELGKRFVDENMNRLFCGEHEKGISNYERVRAKQLELAVKCFYEMVDGYEKRERFHYDLHTAIRASKKEKFAVYPYLHDKPWDKKQLLFLLACGVNTVLLSGNPTATLSYYSSQYFGAHAFTIELGKVMPFGQNDMTKFAQIMDSLIRLMTNQVLPLKEYADEDFLIYKVNQVITKQQNDFEFTFTEDTPNFSVFTKGHLLAFESGAEYRAQFDGEAIVFPNAEVELGQRAVLTVISTKIDSC